MYLLYKQWSIPRFGEVGPVGDHVSGDVPVARPVAQRSAEGLPKDVLQVVSVVRPHPTGVGRCDAPHTVGLGEEV